MEIKVFFSDEGSKYETLTRVSKLIRECLIVCNINDESRISSEANFFLLDLLDQISTEMNKQYYLSIEDSHVQK